MVFDETFASIVDGSVKHWRAHGSHGSRGSSGQTDPAQAVKPFLEGAEGSNTGGTTRAARRL